MRPFPIQHELQLVASRFRQRSLWQNLTLLWVIALAILWGRDLVAYFTNQPSSHRTLLIATFAACLVVWVASTLRRFNLRWVAHQVEKTHPELETKLLAAYEQEQTLPPERRGFLEEAVIQQARTHAISHQHWNQTVPTRQLVAWSAVQWSTFALVMLSFMIHTHWSPTSSEGATADVTPTGETPVAETLAVEVDPGDVELERGADLLVLARFADRQRLPREATLIITGPKGEERHNLQQSLSDPVFAARVPEIKQDLKYHVAFPGQKTRDFHVTIFDYPELERADAEMQYPSYTGLPLRRVEDVRQLSVLEGTELKMICRLNKPVATARLLPKEGEPIELVRSSDDKTMYTLSRTMAESVRWRLELTDERDRHNRQSVEFVIDVVVNRPPDIKLVFPKRDLKVSPLQEIPLEAEVTDDFGVVRWGLAYELPGKTTQLVTWGEKLPAKEKSTGRQTVALEDLKAQPDELLAWHVWAEDLGPDGKTRRTTSDIFFAEVSPFDEIFREGQAPAGEGEGEPDDPTSQLGKLAQLQKEIITATWNIRRREKPDSLTVSFRTDAKLLAESQEKALELLEKLKAKLKSPNALTVVAEIEKQMQTARDELRAAANEAALSRLDMAFPPEQASYQNLLKLRARETRIIKSKKGKGGGQQSAAGQNLDQLEMKEEQDRYETQQQAGDAKQTPAQKEREAITNRLRELAKRQEDLNQKVKELQAALDAARTAEEKKQLERQLKRLRDEQREMLRDVDALKNKMDKPEHNQPLAEASKKLEETRENVRQAADALDKAANAENKEKVSQALTAGTRAESELDKLREDFRKQTSSQFAGEVRDLLDQARQLDARQQQIGEQLTKPKPQPGSGLRAETPQTPLTKELQDQKKQLGEVLEKAREITERAEGNEPLLSKKLYDTIRETHQKQTPRAIEMLNRLVDNGLSKEAAKIEPQAREGVKQLREGIEKAAQGVLGDDVESLRRAKREVDRLAQAVANEIRQEQPGAAPKQTPSQEGAGKPSEGNAAKPGEGNKPGEGKPGDGKPGDGKQNQGQQGQGQQGQGQQGQGQQGQGQQGQGQQGQGQQGQGQQDQGQQGQGQQGQGQQGQGQQGQGQQGQGQQGQGQQGQGQQGQGQQGQGQQGQGQQGQGQQGQGQGQGQPSRDGQLAVQRQPGGGDSSSGNQAGTGSHGVITGPDWREWSDALRNVEEVVPGTRLRQEVARVREQAQAIRAEAKRHSKNPNWDLVREKVYEPLAEIQRQLNEELLRQESPEAVVPLDRDPVPDRFGDAVRKYYERLGSGQ